MHWRFIALREHGFRFLRPKDEKGISQEQHETQSYLQSLDLEVASLSANIAKATEKISDQPRQGHPHPTQHALTVVAADPANARQAGRYDPLRCRRMDL